MTPEKEAVIREVFEKATEAVDEHSVRWNNLILGNIECMFRQHDPQARIYALIALAREAKDIYPERNPIDGVISAVRARRLAEMIFKYIDTK